MNTETSLAKYQQKAFLPPIEWKSASKLKCLYGVYYRIFIGSDILDTYNVYENAVKDWKELLTGGKGQFDEPEFSFVVMRGSIGDEPEEVYFNNTFLIIE